MPSVGWESWGFEPGNPAHQPSQGPKCKHTDCWERYGEAPENLELPPNQVTWVQAFTISHRTSRILEFI